MATTIITHAARAIEHRDIHLAVCWARRQAMRCSTCTELSERAERILRAVAPLGQVARLRPLLERCLSAVVDWQREQRESHPWHVDGWLLEEQIRAALDPGEPPAEPSTEE